MNIFKNANFNFLRWRWYAMGLSLLVIGAGLFVILTRGIPRGLFSRRHYPSSVRQPRSEMQIPPYLQQSPQDVIVGIPSPIICDSVTSDQEVAGLQPSADVLARIG